MINSGFSDYIFHNLDLLPIVKQICSCKVDWKLGYSKMVSSYTISPELASQDVPLKYLQTLDIKRI